MNEQPERGAVDVEAILKRRRRWMHTPDQHPVALCLQIVDEDVQALATALADAEAQRARLEQYAEHRPICAFAIYSRYTQNPPPCNCGLSELLAPPSAAPSDHG